MLAVAFLTLPIVLPNAVPVAFPTALSSAEAAQGSGPIGEPVAHGRARLQTASALSVVVPIRAGDDVIASVDVQVAGKRCRRTVSLSAGSRTVTVPCSVSPRVGDIPRLTAKVHVHTVTAHRARAERRVAVSWPIVEGRPLSAPDALRAWRSLAAPLVEQTIHAQDETFDAAFAAAALTREVFEEGWQGAHVPIRRDWLLQTVKPSGGYGLGRAWDAFGDGSRNSVDTTYAVTSAGHVGDVLLEAYQHGQLEPERLAELMDAVLALPRVDRGRCIAYSDAAADRGKPCVYNVSFGAAAWLLRARQVTGWRAQQIEAVLAAVRPTVSTGYNRRTGYWPYSANNTRPQDLSHQVYTAVSVDTLVPRFGALNQMMRTPWWAQPRPELRSDGVIGSSMIAVAQADCRFARWPGVIAGAKRMVGASTEAFTQLSAANASRAVLQRCFGASP